MNEQQEQKIAQYLNEAHGAELALVRRLQAQIAMTPKGQYRDGVGCRRGRSHSSQERKPMPDSHARGRSRSRVRCRLSLNQSAFIGPHD